MKRHGEAATILIIAILAALGIGGAIYYFQQSSPKTYGNMQSSEDLRRTREIEKWTAVAQEIDKELAGNFGSFFPNALESFDLVPDDRTAWGELKFRRVSERTCFMLPEDFVQTFNNLAQNDEPELSENEFITDLKDGANFNLEQTLDSLLHRVDELKAGVSSSYNSLDTLQNRIASQLADKSVNVFGYVRLIFRTDIEGVYLVAAFSIDPYEVNRLKGRYIATDRKLIISNSRAEILSNIIRQVKFDPNFQVLEFSMSFPDELDENNTVKDCLEKFIAQFGE